MTLEQKLAVLTAVITILGLAAIFFVPEVRAFLHLERKDTKVAKGLAPHVISPAFIISPPPIILASPAAHPTLEDSASLRMLHGVSLIRVVESGLPLPERPKSSFAFVTAPYLTNYSRIPQKVPVERIQAPFTVEVHKLQDGKVELIGFVGSETLTRIRAGLQKSEKLTFFSHGWDEAPHVVSLTLGGLEVIRHRTLQIKNVIFAALDCEVK